MDKSSFQRIIEFAREQASSSTDPYSLCRTLGIETIFDKPLHKDGYLVCEGGCKLILVSSKITNTHRRKFIVSHEIGHFLLHREQLYCCSSISEIGISRINTSLQENEANDFASEFLMPREQMVSLLPHHSVSFSDISKIARHFDVSMTFSAIKAVQLSNAEDEVLLCYEGQKLKWFSCGDKTLRRNKLPANCPIDLESVRAEVDISGAWDSLYEGTVHQEIFHPVKNYSLVLLSGTRCIKED